MVALGRDYPGAQQMRALSPAPAKAAQAYETTPPPRLRCQRLTRYSHRQKHTQFSPGCVPTRVTANSAAEAAEPILSHNPA